MRDNGWRGLLRGVSPPWHSRCLFSVRHAVVQQGRGRISHTRRCAPERRAGGNVMTFVKKLRMFANDESGQDLLEYALLVALIALVAFGAVQLAGGSVN